MYILKLNFYFETCSVTQQTLDLYDEVFTISLYQQFSG